VAGVGERERGGLVPGEQEGDEVVAELGAREAVRLVGGAVRDQQQVQQVRVVDVVERRRVGRLAARVQQVVDGLVEVGPRGREAPPRGRRDPVRQRQHGAEGGGVEEVVDRAGGHGDRAAELVVEVTVEQRPDEDVEGEAFRDVAEVDAVAVGPVGGRVPGRVDRVATVSLDAFAVERRLGDGAGAAPLVARGEEHPVRQEAAAGVSDLRGLPEADLVAHEDALDVLGVGDVVEAPAREPDPDHIAQVAGVALVEGERVPEVLVRVAQEREPVGFGRRRRVGGRIGTGAGTVAPGRRTVGH
jgi:hypothetical protein